MNTSENAPKGDHELASHEVADAEAKAIEDESSAGDAGPPTGLRAPTTTESPVTPDDASTPAAGSLQND